MNEVGNKALLAGSMRRLALVICFVLSAFIPQKIDAAPQVGKVRVFGPPTPWDERLIRSNVVWKFHDKALGNQYLIFGSQGTLTELKKQDQPIASGIGHAYRIKDCERNGNLVITWATESKVCYDVEEITPEDPKIITLERKSVGEYRRSLVLVPLNRKISP